MTLTDVTETSLLVVLIVFVLLCAFSLISKYARKGKGRSWGEMIPSPGRFIGIRLGLAIGLGCSLFVLVAAALTLNERRSPADETPVLKVRGSTGPTTVTVAMDQCGDAADGKVKLRGGRPGKASASIYSDEDGTRPIELNRAGIGTFTLSDPSTQRGVLSCYLQLPKVNGGAGSSVTLTLGNDMEVDAFDSVPSPSSFIDGRWAWDCAADESCGVLATASLAIEDGARQVIVLVLAAVFGAIIALFIGEVLIEPVRRRLDRLKKD